MNVSEPPLWYCGKWFFAYLKAGWNKESGPRVRQLLEQPPAAVNYGEANCQANQDYDWSSEKEFLYHNSHQALAGLLGGFCGLGSIGYSVFIYSG